MQWQYADIPEIFDHIKKAVHCLLKTTDSRNKVIRQKRTNFYNEKEEKMIIQANTTPIALIG
jgi:hypothetical protein